MFGQTRSLYGSARRCLCSAGIHETCVRGGTVWRRRGKARVRRGRTQDIAIRGLVLVYTDGRSLQVIDVDTVNRLKAIEGHTFDVGWPMLIGGLLMLGLAVASFMRQRRLLPMHIGLILGGLALAALSLASAMSLSLRAPVVITAVFVGIVWFVFEFTTVGRRVYAVGGNPETARLSGVNVFAYRLGAFVLCSATAGFATSDTRDPSRGAAGCSADW